MNQLPYSCYFQERLKKEYKNANKTREGYVDESEDEEEPTLTRAGKGLRKTLQKLEKDGGYDESDDDENPYASEVCLLWIARMRRRLIAFRLRKRRKSPFQSTRVLLSSLPSPSQGVNPLRQTGRRRPRRPNRPLR